MFIKTIKNIFLILIFIGILLIIVDYVKKTTISKCPKNKIIYKYIPRSFKEQQDDPIMVSEIFDDLFKQPTPWISSIGIKNQRELK
jgi:hypothetical protein